MNLNAKDMKIKDDLYLYCKAINKKEFYCSLYFVGLNEPSENVYGSGDFYTVIDATYQAIISGMELAVGFGYKRRIRIASDIQFVVNQLTYDEPLASKYLIKKYSEIKSIKDSFSHIRWIWIQRDELIKYLPIPDDKIHQERERKKEHVNYYEYIQSDEWRKRADECKRRAGYRCQICNRGRDLVKLNAHHRTYERLGHEKRSDLICMCQDCHELFEKNSNNRPTNNH